MPANGPGSTRINPRMNRVGNLRSFAAIRGFPPLIARIDSPDGILAATPRPRPVRRHAFRHERGRNRRRPRALRRAARADRYPLAGVSHRAEGRVARVGPARRQRDRPARPGRCGAGPPFRPRGQRTARQDRRHRAGRARGRQPRPDDPTPAGLRPGVYAPDWRSQRDRDRNRHRRGRGFSTQGSGPRRSRRTARAGVSRGRVSHERKRPRGGEHRRNRQPHRAPRRSLGSGARLRHRSGQYSARCAGAAGAWHADGSRRRVRGQRADGPGVVAGDVGRGVFRATGAEKHGAGTVFDGLAGNAPRRFGGTAERLRCAGDPRRVDRAEHRGCDQGAATGRGT